MVKDNDKAGYSFQQVCIGHAFMYCLPGVAAHCVELPRGGGRFQLRFSWSGRYHFHRPLATLRRASNAMDGYWPPSMQSQAVSSPSGALKLRVESRGGGSWNGGTPVLARAWGSVRG